MARALVGVVILLLIGTGWLLLRERPGPSAPPPATDPAPVGEGHLGPYPRSRFFIDRDRFEPATDPPSRPGRDADFLRPSDEVFGVLVGGRARAYPVTMLSYHHVVNDRVGEAAIAVTY
jgi:hypothetical protein